MIKIKTNKYPWFKYYKDMKSTLKYPDTSMYELVKRACIKYPSNIAYSYFGTKVTYKSLLRKIDLCAQSYAKIGVVKNSNVTICSPNTPEAIISFYALNKIGAVVNMLHPLSSEEEIKFALNLTKCEYLFIADIAYSKFKNIRQEIIALGGEVLFNTKLESINFENQKITSVTASRNEIKCDIKVNLYHILN